MSSPFDEAFAEADDTLFDTFAEREPAEYYPPGAVHCMPAHVILHRNLQMVGAGGVFMVVQLAVDLRKSQVPNPERGAVLKLDCKRYALEEALQEDAQLTRYSLNPLD